MRISSSALSLAAALATAPVAVCATAAAAQTITRAEADTAVAAAEKLLSQHYLKAELRPLLAKRLRAGRASGRYATNDVRELAARVTDDLRTVANDGHLSLSWNLEARQNTAAFA